MENYNILVTGAAGLIGSKVYSALKRNNKVVGIDNYSRGVFEDESILKCDVIDFCKQNKNPFHYIFHFAAINGTSHFYNNPNKVLETNIQIDLAMFNFSKGAKLLYCSSSELVADLSYVPTPEVKRVVINDITNPRHSYKMAKMVGENYLNNSDLDYNIVRFYNIVGENDQNGHFFSVASDLALMFPMLEMAGKRQEYIKDLLYVYNDQNPISDHKIRRKDQILAAKEIRRKKRYKQQFFI